MGCTPDSCVKYPDWQSGLSPDMPEMAPDFNRLQLLPGTKNGVKIWVLKTCVSFRGKFLAGLNGGGRKKSAAKRFYGPVTGIICTPIFARIGDWGTLNPRIIDVANGLRRG